MSSDEVVPALDAPQGFVEATSYAVRDEFQELVGRDLLGPWDGETEQFPPRAMGPRERYLVGMLGPKQAPGAAPSDNPVDTDTSVEGDASGEGGSELPEILTPQNLGRIWASSMGLRFCVGVEVDAVHVTAAWGRYAKESIEGADGTQRTVWAREPVTFPREVRLDGEPTTMLPLRWAAGCPRTGGKTPPTRSPKPARPATASAPTSCRR